MPTPEEVEVAELFLRKEGSDLSAARVLARDPDQADDVVGFHAQQAVEKSLKAVLAVRGFEIPRTHDLELLTRLVVPGADALPKELAGVSALSPWAVATRSDDIAQLLIGAWRWSLRRGQWGGPGSVSRKRAGGSVPVERSRRRAPEPLDALVGSFTREELAELVLDAAGQHVDVARAVRLAAARRDDDLGLLRREVDGSLRTRRFLDYWASIEWAQAGRPVVAELERAVQSAPSRELVELIQRAVGHVVKVIQRADDSSGLIGDLARDLLDLHARACDAGVAHPVKLAGWMIRFRFRDQDFFEMDPVRYAGALGEAGMAAYRDAVEQIDDAGSFALRYVRERLAVLDQDTDAIVRLHGGELTHAFQFSRVAEAMAELGRDDLVLEWTSRGIEETEGWQVSTLYDLASEAMLRLGQPLEVLRLRRSQHERMASSSTYAQLREAAGQVGAWEIERPAARAALEARDVRGYIDALLADGDHELAWSAAVAVPPDSLDSRQWLRLAASRERERPADALTVYQAVADEVLQTADRRAYSDGVRILNKAAKAARAAGLDDDFAIYISRLREVYRRRPTLMAMLDKAGFA